MKRNLRILAFALFFFVSIIIPFLSPGRASAAGEQYEWIEGLFRVSGGDLSAPSDLPFVRTENDVINIYAGTLQHESGCTIAIQITSDISTEQIVTSVNQDSSGGTCSQAVKQSYNNLNITDIIQAPPLDPNAVNVVIKIWSPDAVSEGQEGASFLTPLVVDFQVGPDIAPMVNKTVVNIDVNGTTYQMGYYQTNPQDGITLQRGGTYEICPTSTNTVPCETFTVPDDYVSNTVLEVNSQPTPSGSVADPDSCAAQTEGMGWIACPLITTAADAAKTLSNLIVQLLKLDTEALFEDPQTSSAYHAAWAGFRNISYAILVIIGLIMVASQVLNLEILSAYTLRRMLPGLIIAIIFVTLSWDLMEFLYNLSNDAADAVMEIIRLPFQGVDSVRDAIAGGRAQDSFGFAVLGVLQSIGLITAAGGVVIAYAAFGGFGVILALIASLGLGILSIFVLLAARNVVAFFLVISAPIFIMCSAFEPLRPGFNFWRVLVVSIVITVPAVAAILTLTAVASLIAAAA